jgi:hypothetical protein
MTRAALDDHRAALQRRHTLRRKTPRLSQETQVA